MLTSPQRCQTTAANCKQHIWVVWCPQSSCCDVRILTTIRPTPRQYPLLGSCSRTSACCIPNKPSRSCLGADVPNIRRHVCPDFIDPSWSTRQHLHERSPHAQHESQPGDFIVRRCQPPCYADGGRLVEQRSVAAAAHDEEQQDVPLILIACVVGLRPLLWAASCTQQAVGHQRMPTASATADVALWLLDQR